MSTQLYVDEAKIALNARLQEDLGADDLDLDCLHMALGEEFKHALGDEQCRALKTVGDVVICWHRHFGIASEALPATWAPTATFTFGHRYGARTSHEQSEALGVVSALVDELMDERFDEPDDEHYQVSVSRPDDWSLTLYLEGLVRVEHFEREHPPYYKSVESAQEADQVIAEFVNRSLDFASWTFSPAPRQPSKDWLFRTIKR